MGSTGTVLLHTAGFVFMLRGRGGNGAGKSFVLVSVTVNVASEEHAPRRVNKLSPCSPGSLQIAVSTLSPSGLPAFSPGATLMPYEVYPSQAF